MRRVKEVRVGVKVKIAKIMILLCAANCCIAGLGHAQDVNEIVDKYYKMTGGIENWKRLNSIVYFVQTNTYKDSLTDGGTSEELFTIKIDKKITDGLIFERWLTIDKLNPNDTFSTCFNGVNYWRHSNNRTPQSFLSYVNIYRGFVRMGDPLLLLSADSVKFAGMDSISVDGRKRQNFVLRVVLKNGGALRYYIDTENFLMNGHSQDSANAWLYAVYDYRWVGNLYIPFKTARLKENGVRGHEIVTKILLDPTIPDFVFEFPKTIKYVLNKPFTLKLTQP